MRRASRSAPNFAAAPVSTWSGATALKLSQAWGEGMKSLHGTHVHGFPNAFFVQPAQGANLISNVPHNLTEAAVTIAAIVRHAAEQGAREVEVTREAQQAWVELLLTAPPRLIGSPDCTPGYYNNEGQAPTPASRLNVGYPAGPSAYFRYLGAGAAPAISRGWRFGDVLTIKQEQEEPSDAGINARWLSRSSSPARPMSANRALPTARASRRRPPARRRSA